METITVDTECYLCTGTGIYSGFAEPKGVGVICLNCKGTGLAKLSYTPFSARKSRKDIEKVYLSKGSFLLSCGPSGSSISYQDFVDGKIPG